MMLHGYCIVCRKIRRVRVAGAGMGRVAAGQVPTGVCSACQDAEDAKRREGRR